MKKALLLFLFSLSGFSQTIDNTFNPNHQGPYEECIGYNGLITDDGKLLNGMGIRRYNSDGSIDDTFIQNLNNSGEIFFKGSNGKFGTLSLALGSDGEHNIQLFNQDGSSITGFAQPVFTSSTSSNGIWDLAWQADGKIIVVGNFDTVNGLSYKRVARLNADGSVDTTFNPGTGANDVVYCVGQQADGKYVLGGNFTTFSGQAKRRIVRINANGSIDTSFYSYNATTFGFNAPIRNLEIQSDGTIVTSGSNFINNATILSYSASRLLSNGSRDATFNVTIGLDISRKILVMPNGKYLAVDSLDHVIRLNNNGSKDVTFSYSNPSFQVYDRNPFKNLSGNQILINSDYISSTGLTRHSIHRINENGTIDWTFNPQQSTNRPFNTLKVLHNSKLLAIGDIDFTAYNDTPCKYFIRLTAIGELDTTFTIDNQITTVGSNIKEQDDGKLLLFGNNTVNGVYKRIIRINENGTLDTSFNFVNIGISVIYDYEILNDGKILVVLLNTSGSKRYVRYNSDGTLDSGFTPILISSTSRISATFTKFADGTIFKRELTSFPSYNLLYKLNGDGSLDTGFNFPMISGQDVKSIRRQSDGLYLVNMTYSGEETVFRINNTGAIDNTFTTIHTHVNHLFVNSENKIFIFHSNSIDVYSANGILEQNIPGSYSNYIVQQGCDNLLENATSNTTGCPADLIRYNLFTGTMVPPPSGVSPQPFVADYTLANLIVSGADITWYSAQSQCGLNNVQRLTQTNDVPLPLTTPLVNGTTYYASQTIDGIESSYKLPILVSGTLNVDEIEHDVFWISNPVRNNLELHGNVPFDKIEVYNLNGMKLLENEFQNNTFVEISFQKFSKGFYIVKIHSGNSIFSKKIIKE